MRVSLPKQFFPPMRSYSSLTFARHSILARGARPIANAHYGHDSTEIFHQVALAFKYSSATIGQRNLRRCAGFAVMPGGMVCQSSYGAGFRPIG